MLSLSSSALPQEVFAQVTQAWAIQDYGEGERLLAAARQRYPDHWHLRTCHAAAIAYCSRFRSAREAFDSLLADSPPEKRIHMHGLLGVEWCRIGRHDLAVPLLQVAASAPAPPAPVFEALASALDHLRDHAVAKEVLDEGLRQHPGHPGILLVRAAVLRQAGFFDEAETTARAILANPLASPDAQARAGHELGHALDRQGRYAEAFAAYTAAKQVRSAQLGHFQAIWEETLRHVRNSPLPSQDQFLRWRSDFPADACRPVSMLVGCPRSGTTLLERVLDAHPGVVSASETVIFSNLWSTCLRAMPGVRSTLDALDQLNTANLESMRRQYFAEMEDALEQPLGDRVLLDKNPSQLTRLPAILRVFPAARVLMALRDPRAIAWSCFTQYLPDNAESAGFNRLDTTVLHVEAQLRYWLRLRERLPEGSWHESRYERMVSSFDEESENVLGFLGLAWDARVADYHHNPRPVRSPTYAEAALPIYSDSLEKWRHYEEFAGDALRKLAPLAQDLNASALA